ncbi:MAG: oligopeptide transporter ATP-binding protein OppF, partial [Rhodoferax sp.]|nr:oligopeptide transporter ATP-binding protein OppF [Rhodoferax sp.]
MAPLLSVRDLHVHFKVRGSGRPWAAAAALKAVNGLSFDLRAGET